MTRSAPLPLVLLVIAAACGDPAPDPDAAPTPVPVDSAAEPAPPGVGEDTPAPGLTELVAGIRSGIAVLPAAVEADPAAARQEAVRLYVTRQEEIERQWGPNGVAGPSPELSDAVEAAEGRFHGLMELMGSEPPPDSVAVAEAVEALDAAQAEVLRQADAP